MNAPASSHMGGVWERQIRSMQSILLSLLEDNGLQLDDKSLRTLMCEVEAVINSRPLTADFLTNPCSQTPLTPNQLLTMKTKVVLPPPGVFPSVDILCKKRWRCVSNIWPMNFGLAGRMDTYLAFSSVRSGQRPGRIYVWTTL